jgi:histidyl-tRNA synthetase
LLEQAQKEEEVVDEIAQLDVEKEFVNENFKKMEELNKFAEKGIGIIDVSGVEGALDELDVDVDKLPEKRLRSVYCFII